MLRKYHMAQNAEVASFLEDLFENLGVIEVALLRLEDDTENTEYLHEIFRSAHTIKGNASMMNLTNLVALAHALETALQEAIAANITVGQSTLSIFNEARMGMVAIGEALHSDADTSQVAIRETTDQIQVLLLTGEPQKPKTAENAHPGEREVDVRLQIARAELAPSVRAFLVETKLAELGTIIRKEPSDEKLETPEFIASARNLSFILRTSAHIAEIRDHLNIDLIEGIEVHEVDLSGTAAPAFSPGPAAIERGRTNIVHETASSGGDTIRLPVKTLDRLLNLTGELVIANSGLNQIAETIATIAEAQSESSLLTEKNREIFRIAAEIQSIVMKSRMLPIEHVFSRFRRFVRDYADKAGKAIRLDITGAETELDKRVIDEIVKPLTHLIRNSLDHGFEAPHERIAAGKTAEGTLRISAAQAGSSILIIVEDDGRGMHLEKILARAIDRGLIDKADAAGLSPERIRDFIFEPGFSTKDSADDLSGRGFGMDIVRDSIKKLSGDLTVTSVEGKGTKMLIRLPLTLAILTALTFKLRNDIFAIPLTAIEESVRVPIGSIVEVEGRELLHTRNTMLPFIRLDRVLGYPKTTEAQEFQHSYAIIADLHGQRIALCVDEFLKKQELVVKSLDENYAPVRGLAGAAILGNNEIIFIIDVPEIVAIYEDQRANAGFRPTGTSAVVARVFETEENDAGIEMPANRVDLVTPPPDLMEPVLDIADKELVRKWIAQSNKTAVQGIQMLTGKTGIAVKKSRGSRIKPDKSQSLVDRISARAEDIYLIHLPMLPAAGAIDLILGRRDAELMSNLLMNAAGFTSASGFDPSPLLEITNILGSAYTNTLAFLTNKSVEPATPSFLATAHEIRTLVDERLRTPQSEILVIENEFHIETDDIEVELVIYLKG